MLKVKHLLVFCLFAAGLSGCGVVSGKGEGGLVTLAPHLTETVFALGEGDRVVGVGDYCDFPADVKALPKMGGYLDPKLEQLALLSPELIILPGQHEKVTEFAHLHAMPILNVHMDSFESIYQGIDALGISLDCQDAAADLKAKIHADADKLRAGLASSERPKVLIVTGRQTHDLNTINTAGSASFVSEMIDLAGGENIFKDNSSAYFEASKEDIVMRAPDVILEFRCGESLTEKQQQSFYNDWQAVNTVPAVKNGRIYFVFESHGLRPGPRVVEVAREIAAKLHPVEMASL